MTLDTSDQSQLFMDTGATSHVTTDEGIISNPLQIGHINYIYVGNGHSIPIKGSCNATLSFPNHSSILKTVMLEPQIIKNLISIRKFTSENYVYVEFDSYGFSVKDLIIGMILSRQNSYGELYLVTSVAPLITILLSTSSSNLWHNRLGHPSDNILDHLFLILLLRVIRLVV